ncbi:GNAT family N-acetyltransferase [Shimia abyssi]|nr:GNAT family N-acetyltransferase [Shimia abyssi]
MTDPTVRRATVDDIPAMARIVTDWEKATGWMQSPYTHEEITGFIRDAFDAREIWVAGAPVEAYLSYDPETGRIGGIYCARPGKGLGKALMDTVKKGRTSIWLHTHVPNEAAQRFYKREGFVEVSRHDGDLHDKIREIRMEWSA